jgi:hypothetical protein
MMEVGVASPSAHGQAMISTATALSRARLNDGCGPKANQTMKVSAAMPRTTGTK